MGFLLVSGIVGNLFTCPHTFKFRTRLSRDQRPTKPVNRLVAGREGGGGGGGVKKVDGIFEKKYLNKLRRS